jgi:hypothetical protein
MATLRKNNMQGPFARRHIVANWGDARREDAEELEVIAKWMDSAFRIPGVRWRFGLDALIGLIPGLGDAATSLIALYLIAKAQRMGVSRATLARMAINTGVDLAIGAIPLVGDAFDVFFKSNQRNVDLLRKHAQASGGEERRMKWADRAFVGSIIVALGLLVAAAGMAAYYLAIWIMRAMQNLGA